MHYFFFTICMIRYTSWNWKKKSIIINYTVDGYPKLETSLFRFPEKTNHYSTSTVTVYSCFTFFSVDVILVGIKDYTQSKNAESSINNNRPTDNTTGQYDSKRFASRNHRSICLPFISTKFFPNQSIHNQLINIFYQCLFFPLPCRSILITLIWYWNSQVQKSVHLWINANSQYRV